MIQLSVLEQFVIFSDVQYISKPARSGIFAARVHSYTWLDNFVVWEKKFPQLITSHRSWKYSDSLGGIIQIVCIGKLCCNCGRKILHFTNIKHSSFETPFDKSMTSMHHCSGINAQRRYNLSQRIAANTAQRNPLSTR